MGRDFFFFTILAFGGSNSYFYDARSPKYHVQLTYGGFPMRRMVVWVCGALGTACVLGLQ